MIFWWENHLRCANPTSRNTVPNRSERTFVGLCQLKSEQVRPESSVGSICVLFYAVAPLWRCDRGGLGCGRGRTHLRGERGCLPDRCRAPQEGRTPLHRAAIGGHPAVVAQLLAAGAAKEARDQVCVCGGGAGEGPTGNTHLFVSYVFAFL
jgi:hypothetical protein